MSNKVYFNSDELINKLRFYYDSKLNVLLTGKQGIGKTEIIKRVFSEKCGEINSSWLYFSGATMDPFVDFIGVPKEKKVKGKDSYLEFIRPSYMHENIQAIFCDEFNRSARKVRNALMELIQFKSLNGKKFPKLNIIWAAINPYNLNEDEDDNNDNSNLFQVDPLDPAQQDRFQIQIEIPYAPDPNYFEKKYGQKISEASIEWWYELPEKIRNKISPRRLDYTLDLYKIGGDLEDVIPFESNPSKLLVSIKMGSIEKIVGKLFNIKDSEMVREFLDDENNYQASSELILEEKYYRYFVPFLNEERKIAAFFSNFEFKKIVLENPINFSELLQMIVKNSLCDQETTKQVIESLDKIKGINITNFKSSTIQSPLPPLPLPPLSLPPLPLPSSPSSNGKQNINKRGKINSPLTIWDNDKNKNNNTSLF